MKEAHDIGTGMKHCIKLLGKFKSEPIPHHTEDDPFPKPLVGADGKVARGELNQLLEKQRGVRW